MTTPKLAQQINSSQVGSVEVPYSLETLRKARLQMGQRIAELSTENASLKQQLTDLTACLEWADEHLEIIEDALYESGWTVETAERQFTAPTLLQALTTAYENRDKTKE